MSPRNRSLSVAAAGVLLLMAAGAAAARAQEPRPGPPVHAPEAEAAGTLPRALADSLLAFYNAPTTIQFAGRTRLPAGRTIAGDVGVLGGPLSLAGRIEGDLLVIDGDLELQPGARVTGSVTVVGGFVSGLAAADVEVQGEVVTYPDRIRYRRVGRRVVPERGTATDLVEEADDRWLARSDILVASGRSYNRVEGLPITVGPVVETAGSNPTRLRAMAIYRTESGATLDPDRLGYFLNAEQSVGGRQGVRVGGTMHSTVEPIEEWQVMNLENSLSTFVLHRDLRDHYEREGWSAFARMTLPRRPWDLTLLARSERHRALASGSPWTLFRNQESWRPQPLAAEGRVRLLELEGRYDTRSPAADPAHGWYVRAAVERTLSSELERPDAVRLQPPEGEPALLPAERFPSWTHGFVDLRRYNRLSPEARLNLRVVAGGSLDGSRLPPQRQHALGGEGSLPGHALFRIDCGARDVLLERESAAPPAPGRRDPRPVFVPAYGCDQFVLVQAEYRGRMSLSFGWGGAPWGDSDGASWDLGWAAAPEWVAFVDAGRGWGIGGRSDDLALDLGFGLLFSRVGVYLAAPLTGEGGLNVFVRLGPRL